MGDCNLLYYPVACGIDAAVDAGTVAAEGPDAFFQRLAERLGESVTDVVRLVAAGWTTLPSPTIAGDAGAVPWLSTHLRPITYLVLVLSLIAAGARLAWEQRGEDARDLAWSMVRYVVITGAGTTIMNLLVTAGDAYTVWILDASTRGATGQTAGVRMAELLSDPALANPGGSIAVILLFTAMVVAGLVQLVLIYARLALLVLMAALLPIAAAAALTQRGRQTLDTALAFGLAWILFKPAAATLYAGGFVMIAYGDRATRFAGCATFVMAGFALPATVRLLVPPTKALTGGSGGGAAAALGAAGGAVGAVRGLGGGGGGGGGTPADRMPIRDVTDEPSGAPDRLALPAGGQSSTGKDLVSTATSRAGTGPVGAAASAGVAGAKAISSVAHEATGEEGQRR